MKEFPRLFKPNNTFLTKVLFNRIKCYLRKEIFEHVLTHEEKEYFSIDEFISKHTFKKDDVKNALKHVIEELVMLGWKCSMSFGDTGLFIYADKKPSNCWDSEALDE